MTESKARYKGVLAKPITLPADGTDESRTAFMSQYLDRLAALYAHFGIDPQDDADPWFSLARALAERHVPGFRVVVNPKSAGRRRTWKRNDGIRLYALVQKYLNAGAATDRDAVNAVIENEDEFADFRSSERKQAKQKQRTLYTRYMEVKRTDTSDGNPFVLVAGAMGTALQNEHGIPKAAWLEALSDITLKLTKPREPEPEEV